MPRTTTVGVIPPAGVWWTLDKMDPTPVYGTTHHLTYRGTNGSPMYHLYLQEDGTVECYRITPCPDQVGLPVKVLEPGIIPSLIEAPEQLWDHIAWDRSDTHDDLARLGMV